MAYIDRPMKKPLQGPGSPQVAQRASGGPGVAPTAGSAPAPSQGPSGGSGFVNLSRLMAGNQPAIDNQAQGIADSVRHEAQGAMAQQVDAERPEANDTQRLAAQNRADAARENVGLTQHLGGLEQLLARQRAGLNQGEKGFGAALLGQSNAFAGLPGAFPRLGQMMLPPKAQAPAKAVPTWESSNPVDQLDDAGQDSLLDGSARRSRQKNNPRGDTDIERNERRNGSRN